MKIVKIEVKMMRENVWSLSENVQNSSENHWNLSENGQNSSDWIRVEMVNK